MSLFTATLLLAVILLTVGGLLLWNGKPVSQFALKSLRSKGLALLTFGAGAAWFLYKISQLGEADFGNYKTPLLLAFSSVAVLSWFFLPDFLGVRGLCILILMCAPLFLQAAYMEEPLSRLLMVSFVYLCIVIALYLGALPYRLRDFFKWLFTRRKRVGLLGAILFFYGLLLVGAAFSY